MEQFSISLLTVVGADSVSVEVWQTHKGEQQNKNAEGSHRETVRVVPTGAKVKALFAGNLPVGRLGVVSKDMTYYSFCGTSRNRI